MVQIHRSIVRARYTDADHDHAIITVEGHGEQMISRREHPVEWSEMMRSVVLVEFNRPDPVSASAPQPAAIPAPAPVLQLPAPVTVPVADPDVARRVAALEAALRDLKSRPSAAVDVSDLAGQVITAVEQQWNDLRDRIDELERIQREIYARALKTVEAVAA